MMIAAILFRKWTALGEYRFSLTTIVVFSTVSMAVYCLELLAGHERAELAVSLFLSFQSVPSFYISITSELGIEKLN
jgi:hypothetical protein